MAFVEDPDVTHERGMVLVGFPWAANFFPDMSLRNLRVALPDYFLGAHLCYHDPVLRVKMAGVRLFQFCNPNRRFILQTHEGNTAKILRKLEKYGIDRNTVPFEASEGARYPWSTDMHQIWLEERQKKEKETPYLHDLEPRRFDVLFGKSNKSLQHPGNLRCNRLVDMYQSKYEKANRRDKTAIASQLVSIIHESNGRFLKKATKGHGWVEVEDTVARDKISHFFRQRREAMSQSN